jgi:crotonobetaine/carnitine-CoA ligase
MKKPVEMLETSSLIADRTLGGVLRHHALHRPDRVFLRENERSLTFGATNLAVNRIAAGLRQMGAGPGDRIGILMHSAIEYVLVVLAASKLGVVWVPVNTDYKGDWLRGTIAGSRPKMLVTDPALFANLQEIAADFPDLKILIAGGNTPGAEHLVNTSAFEQLAADEPDLATPLQPADTAAILWTSGTTGKPKGVMQSHNAWIRTGEIGNISFETRDGDIVYNCLPLYNSAAWSANIFRALVGGITVALDKRFSVNNFWDRIRFYGATQTISIGAGHMFLWNQPERPDDADNPLRIATFVPVPHDLIDGFCRRFGIEALTQGFGQSEIMALMGKTNRPGVPAKPMVLGVPHEDLEVKLLHEDGTEAAIGEVGEFCVRPRRENVIFNGYFENPEATANAFVNGWYRMGDLGKRDADGDFYFVDRKKDFIRYKGRNMSSFEIESVAGRHPAVAAAAVFGVPSDELESESEVKLNVVLKPGETLAPQDLARFINDRAPYFLGPRYIEICNALPYTPTGKVEKYKLREMGITAATWDRQASDFELIR